MQQKMVKQAFNFYTQITKSLRIYEINVKGQYTITQKNGFTS